MLLFLTRISPVAIVREHFATFYDATNRQRSSEELALLGSIAAVASTLTWLASPSFSSDFASALLNFFAIVGGFQISALFMVVTYGETILSNKGTLPKSEVAEAKELQKEIFSNVSFGVLVSFLGAAACVALSVGISERLIGTLLTAIAVLFLHTLLMVLKRLEALFRRTV